MKILDSKTGFHLLVFPRCAPSIDQDYPLPVFGGGPIIIRQPTKEDLDLAEQARKELQMRYKPSLGGGGT